MMNEPSCSKEPRPGRPRWGRTAAAWEAAVEAEALRSRTEQGLPREVEDEATLEHVALTLEVPTESLANVTFGSA